MPTLMHPRSADSSLRLCLLALVVALLVACRSSPPTRADAIPAPASSQCGLPNKGVAEYSATVLSAPPAIVTMLKAFPKGGDIHNHLSGTVMPEDYIAMGIADGDCYGRASDDPNRLAIRTRGTSGVCDPNDQPLSDASKQDTDKLVQSLSMYQFTYPTIQAGHDQFFAAFPRFGAVSGSQNDRGKMLAKLLVQAEMDSVSYVETMMSFQSAALNDLAKQLRQQFPDPAAFADPRQYPAMYGLIASGLARTVAAAGDDISLYISLMRDALGCAKAPQNPGCAVTFRFLSEVNRNSVIQEAPDFAKMFTQTAISFSLANLDARVVGVNLVSGEDLPISMKSFPVQMQHFSYFHSIFPKVSFALHGGELTPCFVGTGNPALFDHLAGSITAGAKRLGHGISFAYLDANQKVQVAQLMRTANVLVEIPFASNAQILGVAGTDHPFTQYFRDLKIPTAFATDDEGVSHSDYTSEWVYAYLQYGLRYAEAVKLARLSLQYSFLPGSSLWQDASGEQVAAVCQQAQPGSPVPPGSPCDTFLKDNAKAKLQWDLEARLTRFREIYGRKQWQ
jgi:adenosine deaminase